MTLAEKLEAGCMVREESRDSDLVRNLLNDILPSGRGYIAMLKAYLDRGAKPDAGRVMCIAAALFDPFNYERFLHEWQPFLDGWNAMAFHATDFYPGARAFKRKRPDGSLDPEKVARYERDSRHLVEIIGAYVHQLFVVTFWEDEYVAVAPQAWRDQFGDVHRIAAQLMAGSIGHWANRVNYDGEIAYFYETGGKGEAAAHEGLKKLYDRPDQRKHTRMASTPIGVEKGKAHGLEVADFLAWQWNKYAVDSLPPTRIRPMRKDMSRLTDILSARNKKVDVRFLTGQPLVDFLIDQGCYRKSAITTGVSV